MAPAQEGVSVSPSQPTAGATDPSTLMLAVMTGRGGRSDFSTALASVMGISAATAAGDADTGSADPTVTRGFLWVRERRLQTMQS